MGDDEGEEVKKKNHLQTCTQIDKDKRKHEIMKL